MDNQNDRLKESILTIASETFRFQHVFERAISKLDIEEQKKYSSQYAWFSKKVGKALDEAGMHIINLEGQIYDPGMMVVPLNLDDFNPDDELFVEQMMEPIVMQGDTVLKEGTVLLGRVINK